MKLKLKLKAKILLGTFVVSGIFSQMCNFSSVYASGRMKGSRAITLIRRDRRVNLAGLYGKLKIARNDRIRDRLLKEFDAEHHVSPFHSEDCSNGDTLLHIAAHDGNVEVFSYLLDKVEKEERICMQKNMFGRTIVHEAVLSENHELVKVLVNKRAYDIDFEVTDAGGKRPIDLARAAIESKGRRQPLLRIVSILTSAANVMRMVHAPSLCLNGVEAFVTHDTVNMMVYFNNGEPMPLVVYALDIAKNTSFKVVRNLLGMGAERVDYVWGTTDTDSDMWSELFGAHVRDDTVDELRHLLDILPFDPSFGGSYIYEAVENQSPKALKFLLENCMPRESDIDEAIKKCAFIRRYDLAKMLISQPGYNLDSLHIHGGQESLLHSIARSQNMEKVRFLLEIGADPNVRDAQGQLPIDLLKNEEDKLQFKKICEALQQVPGNILDVPGFELPDTPGSTLPSTPICGSPTELDYKRLRRM